MAARILIIEDNSTNMELMVYLLKAFGYVTETAFNGREGVEKALLQPPDLVVCDLEMPEMNGYEVAQALRSHESTQKIPLIAVTAFAMVGDRNRVLAAGFRGYISKPISPEMFVQELEAFLPGDHRATYSPAREETPAASAPAPKEKRGAILVLDDSPINLSLIQSTLEPVGYRVIPAHSVAEAMERAEQNSCDLILSDLHLPVADGMEFLALVKAHPKLHSIPFVLLTASGQGPTDTPDLALAHGAKLFLRRPIEPELLLSAIDKVLRESRGA